MMLIREIRKNAIEKYKKHKLNSWIISIICALFIAALVLVGILSEFLLIALLPLVILPFFFACVLSHLSLSDKDELTFSKLFSFYRLFFKQPFVSSFSAIKSFLKALLVQLVLTIAVSAICYSIYSQSETFVVTLNQVIESLSDMSITNEQFQAALEANGGELGHFIDLTNAIGFLIFSFTFILFVMKEEIIVFLRINLKNIPLANQIAKASIRVNSKNFHKQFFALNWPIFLILLAGMVGGVILSIMVFDNYAICGVVGLSIGLVLTAIFLPFYFANMETIFEQLSIDLASFSEEYIQKVFDKYGVNVDVQQEEVDGTKKDPDDPESK